ncbi:MAG: hypothetical protein EP330_02845 [Deltaproteobacteria bacterium]|nr:MAG: hypothetical protein EP330_02845 [Deltaproteobacteria bacterium]
MLSLFLVAALAGPMDLATGADLTAIRAIETGSLSNAEAVEAWRAFLLAFPDSPLATVAWRALAELEGTEGEWIPPDRQAAMGRIARQAAAEDAEVERALLGASVAQLHPDGSSLVTDEAAWGARTELDLGWDGRGYGAFGVGISRGPAAGILRIGRQRAWYAELAGRLKGPMSFGPWAEVHVDSLLRPGITGGGEVALWEGLEVEARAGFLLDDGAIYPRIGTALVYRLPVGKQLIPKAR